MRTIWKYFALFCVLLSCMAGSFASAATTGERRLAFVVGNSAYPTSPLTTTGNDAGLIAQTLQAAGFEVMGARDLDQEALRGSYRDFLNKAAAAGPDTITFVYLAGYGLQYQGENYFIPVDSRINKAADIPLASIRISDMTAPLASLTNKVNIFVLDAGRANQFAQGDQPMAGGLALVDPAPNMLIAFNASPGTIAPIDQGPYGAYARALAEMIREGGIQLSDIFDRTRLRVAELTQGAELPWNASQITTAFQFFERAPQAPAPQQSAAQLAAQRSKPIHSFSERDAYYAALDRDTLSGYEDFIAAFPNDAMVKRIRAILAVRREAYTWHETVLQDTPDSYWSYLQRYPHGAHNWDARWRLHHLNATLQAPDGFTAYAYQVPPPPSDEDDYTGQPQFYYDDPHYGFPPPPPPPADFMPPRPRDFVNLAPPPPPPADSYSLPVPVFVPVPEWVNTPRDLVPPADNALFGNIHDANMSSGNGMNGSSQPAAGNQATVATPQPTNALATAALGAAAGAGAIAIANHVPLPAFLQKKTPSGRPPVNSPAMAPTGVKPTAPVAPIVGSGPVPANPVPAKVPAVPAAAASGAAIAKPIAPAQADPASPQDNTGKHALPGAGGKPLPPVNSTVPPVAGSKTTPVQTPPTSVPPAKANPAPPVVRQNAGTNPVVPSTQSSKAPVAAAPAAKASKPTAVQPAKAVASPTQQPLKTKNPAPPAAPAVNNPPPVPAPHAVAKPVMAAPAAAPKPPVPHPAAPQATKPAQMPPHTPCGHPGEPVCKK